MIVNYGHEREGEQHLIEDIVPPQARSYFDVRDAKVRRTSIGTLDQQYLSNRLKADANHAVLQPAGAGFTRVPPLLSLPDVYGNADRHLQNMLLAITAFIESGMQAVTVLASQVNRQTRRYLRKMGIDLRKALPIALVLLLIVVAFLAWPSSNSSKGTGQSHKSNGGSLSTGGQQAVHHAVTAASVKSSSTSNPSISSGPAATAPTTAFPAATGLNSSSPSTAPAPSAVGGLGGGATTVSAPAPTTTATPTPSPTPCPPTVTVPPTSVSVAGQPVVSTTGLSVPLP